MKLSFDLISNKLLTLTNRFPITTLFVLAFFVLAMGENGKLFIDTPASLWLFFGGGIVITLASSLFFEDYRNKIINYSVTIALAALLGVYCYFLPSGENGFTTVVVMRTSIIIAVFALSMFFIPFLKKNSDAAYWNFSMSVLAQLVLAYVFAGILFGGLSLALFSIDSLFDINIKDKVYIYLAIVCFLLFAPIFFLANIPHGENKFNSTFITDKTIKIFGLYILMPILGVYASILYIYLIQILVNWDLPRGWVSSLVSILVMGGLLGITLLYPIRMTQKNKAVTLISRYFSLLVMPLLLLMLMGILRRISDYGLTINRCYVLLANLWFFGICIYLFLTKAKHIKWIYISFTLILALSAFGPWSTFSITKYAMLSNIEQHFEQAGLLEKGKISLQKNSLGKQLAKLDKSAVKKVRESILYLNQYYGMESLQQFFDEDVISNGSSSKQQLIDFGYNNNNQTLKITRKWFTVSESDWDYNMDIKPYNNYLYIRYLEYPTQSKNNILYSLKENNQLLIKSSKKGKTFSIPLDKTLKTQIQKEEKNKRIILTGKNFKLRIHNVDGYYYPEVDSVEILNLKGELFYK